MATTNGAAAAGKPPSGSRESPTGSSTTDATDTDDQRNASWSCARLASAFQTA